MGRPKHRSAGTSAVDVLRGVGLHVTRVLTGGVAAAFVIGAFASSSSAASVSPDTCSPTHVPYTFESSNGYTSGTYKKGADGCANPWIVTGQTHWMEALVYIGQDVDQVVEHCTAGQVCNFNIPNGYDFQFVEDSNKQANSTVNSNIYF